MSEFSLTLVLQFKTSIIIYDMANVAKKFKKSLLSVEFST